MYRDFSFTINTCRETADIRFQEEKHAQNNFSEYLLRPWIRVPYIFLNMKQPGFDFVCSGSSPDTTIPKSILGLFSWVAQEIIYS